MGKRQNRAVKAADTTVKAEVPASIPATVVVGETAGTVKAEVPATTGTLPPTEVSAEEFSAETGLNLGAMESAAMEAAGEVPPVPPTTTPESTTAGTVPPVTPREKGPKAPTVDTRPRGYGLTPGGIVSPVRVTHTSDGGATLRVVVCGVGGNPETEGWNVPVKFQGFRIPLRDYVPFTDGLSIETVRDTFAEDHAKACESLSTYVPPSAACVVWIVSNATETVGAESHTTFVGSGFYSLTYSADRSTVSLSREGNNTVLWTMTVAELTAADSFWTIRVIPGGRVGSMVRDILSRAGDTLASVSHYAGFEASRECFATIISTIASNPPVV